MGVFQHDNHIDCSILSNCTLNKRLVHILNLTLLHQVIKDPIFKFNSLVMRVIDIWEFGVLKKLRRTHNNGQSSIHPEQWNILGSVEPHSWDFPDVSCCDIWSVSRVSVCGANCTWWTGDNSQANVSTALSCKHLLLITVSVFEDQLRKAERERVINALPPGKVKHQSFMM